MPPLALLALVVSMTKVLGRDEPVSALIRILKREGGAFIRGQTKTLLANATNKGARDGSNQLAHTQTEKLACFTPMEEISVVAGEEEEDEILVEMGSYKVPIRLVRDPSEEILLLWAIQQPTHSKQNALVRQSSLQLVLEACGHRLSISQSPSSMTKPGVTGAVMWDSGIVLGKFLEHSVDSSSLLLQSKKIIELGSGCGLVGCIAALLGGQVVLTDLPDRLRLLRKNVEANVGIGDIRGCATVAELIWGDDPDPELIDPLPDYVIASDVIYSEGAVTDLLITLGQLCGSHTTVILTGELRNDAILEYFLELAMKEFVVGRVDQANWHPDYCSSRVVMLVLVKKSKEPEF